MADRYARMHGHRRLRGVSGQALIEGVMSLVMLTMITIGLTYFSISLSLTSYYKQQLGFVATQAATYAANRPKLTAQDDTNLFVSSMEQQMNLGSGSADVVVSATTLNGMQATLVTVQDRFPILGRGKKGLLQVSLKASAVAENLAYLPVPDFWVGSSSGHGFLPGYNPGTNVTPSFGSKDTQFSNAW